ncbi:MAG TPA: thiamine pyrophosphate-binding protein, partial [Humidesulfovibrio sp.]|uniref:thiamine pyrophosphate-binding protein n=1 Tax=Humidesulfovibrio sp. TaxID=2910988 RepID=UPI002B5D9DE9
MKFKVSWSRSQRLTTNKTLQVCILDEIMKIILVAVGTRHNACSFLHKPTPTGWQILKTAQPFWKGEAAMKMTPSEALAETLVAEGVQNVFGIVGSAFMDLLDLFPAAGIRFIPCAHEQAAAHAADGLARVTGKPQACIAQNGPGALNFVSAITAAFWAHSPV